MSAACCWKSHEAGILLAPSSVSSSAEYTVTMMVDVMMTNLCPTSKKQCRSNHSTGGSITSKNGQATLASSWDFNTFNSAHPHTKAWMEDFVEGSPRVSVPYRCNRMVLFKSSLLHKTSRCTFKPGYLNRRVRNLCVGWNMEP